MSLEEVSFDRKLHSIFHPGVSNIEDLETPAEMMPSHLPAKEGTTARRQDVPYHSDA